MKRERAEYREKKGLPPRGLNIKELISSIVLGVRFQLNGQADPQQVQTRTDQTSQISQVTIGVGASAAVRGGGRDGPARENIDGSGSSA